MWRCCNAQEAGQEIKVRDRRAEEDLNRPLLLILQGLQQNTSTPGLTGRRHCGGHLIRADGSTGGTARPAWVEPTTNKPRLMAANYRITPRVNALISVPLKP